MPSLSVVIPFVNSATDLEATLQALDCERDSVSLEIVVVDRQALDGASTIVGPRPWAKIVSVPPNTAIPSMRATGVEHATAPVVAIIEDHVIVRRGWAARLVAEVSAATPAVGGAVDNDATASFTDWAAYLCEYGPLAPPLRGGEVSWLAGNNVAYWRPILLRHLGLMHSGAWEDEVHAAIRQDGFPLICDPDLVVGHRKHVSAAAYVRERFHFSRALTGRRLAERGWAYRIAFASAVVVLPVVLFLRITRVVAAKRRLRSELVRSLPLLGLFVVAWAAGDLVGAVAGGGNSLVKVR